MKNFVPRLINGVVIFGAGALTTVAIEGILIVKAAGKAGKVVEESNFVYDSILPGIKNTICDSVEKIFFGSTRRENNRSYSKYRSCSYEFDNKHQGTKFYNEIIDQLRMYGTLTVAEVKGIYKEYSHNRAAISHEDFTRGWSSYDIKNINLSLNACVVDMPEPVHIRRD